jgi:predicted MPP superfamily phosphohydrolase
VEAKLRKITPKHFSSQREFPGTSGNTFDRILHFDESISTVPSIVWVIFYTLVAYLCSHFNAELAAILLLFMATDALLLRGLPLLKRSFGPVRPVWLTLEPLRFLFWLIPMPANLIFEIIGSLLIIYGFYFEPLSVRKRTFDIQHPKLPAGSSLKVLHFGDLHMERFTVREQKILAFIEQEKPDLILFSGDLLNLTYLHDPVAHSDMKYFLNQLQAPLGIWGVKGSPSVDLPELFPDLIENTPLKLLEDQQVLIHSGGAQIDLVGLTCSHNPDTDHARLSSFVHNNGHFSILLHHSPDIAPLTCNDGFDLQLSGHTHGGQIRIPGLGALFTGSLYGKQLESGIYKLREMLLYVTRGIGLEGAIAPRVRVFCPPEIMFFTLHA